MAVDEASLSTEMDSMSEELRSLRSCTAFITPSTTISGSLPAVMEREPRMRMEVPSVGSPETLMMSAPATRPCKAWSTEMVAVFSTSCILTTATEPVRSAFLASPKPITTTSSRYSVSSSRTKSKLRRVPTFILTLLYPRDSATRREPSPGTLRENFPAASVTVPFAVPSTETVAPGSGAPLWSRTVPVTGSEPFWARAGVTHSAKATANGKNNLFNMGNMGYSFLCFRLMQISKEIIPFPIRVHAIISEMEAKI